MAGAPAARKALDHMTEHAAKSCRGWPLRGRQVDLILHLGVDREEDGLS